MGGEVNSDTTSGGSVKCYRCGASPAFIRPTGRPPPSPALCRDCLVSLTRNFNDNIVESTGVAGGESQESFDVGLLWEHFDTASHTFGLLHGFDVQVGRGDRTICANWKCDSADRPSTRVDVEVALVKAYLERCGYHEVIIVKGIDADLAARGRLGSFYEEPDPQDPNWTVRIKFDRDGGPPQNAGARFC